MSAWRDTCDANPDGATHECMAGERRCVYCGVSLEGYPCHGCGDFMTAADMSATDTTHGVHRCASCV